MSFAVVSLSFRLSKEKQVTSLEDNPNLRWLNLGEFSSLVCDHTSLTSQCTMSRPGNCLAVERELAGFYSGETALLDFILQRGKYFSTFLSLTI